jgi:secreted trypsin-like serine protease
MKKTLGLLAALGAAVLLGALPAAAITNGSLDGDGHPYVGLMAAGDGAGNSWVCSGTLISPRVFVTAGHCTYGAGLVEVYLSAAPQGGTGFVEGAAHTSPGFDPATFWLHDVGVVVLDSDVQLPQYGSLPAAHALDGLSPGAQTTFTTVGYGVQKIFPDQGASSRKDQWTPVRMVATPHLVTIDNPSLGAQSLVLSANANTGGTCYGDSGGPSFLGDSSTIAAVTSYGKSPTCGGTSGAFRLDQPDVLAWIATFPGS